MQRFLDSCAAYVYNRFSGSFTELTIVLPNRRAGIFFTSYLRSKLHHPVIGPAITTIHELMYSFSALIPADRLRLISVLYESWRKHTGINESFDDFWFWGDMLLNDFDDIDKYLVDARDLFRSLSQVKEIEGHFDYLSDEQKRILEQFWGALRNWEKYEQERKFISIWDKLRFVYDDFREILGKEGVGYDGMVIRDGTERLVSGFVDTSRLYLFIGMNALNPCEKKILSFLKMNGKAYFLWDYDDFYLNDASHPAGMFIRENLALFPPPEDFIFDTGRFVLPKKIELIAVPSGFGQAQVVPRFLKQSDGHSPERFDHAAIVLADESLLFPVLGAIPAHCESINVTMGYPLRNSPVVSLLLQVAEMVRDAGTRNQCRLYFRQVAAILHHPLISDIETEKVRSFLQQAAAENQVYLSPSQLEFSDLHRQIFHLPAGIDSFAPYFLDILKLLVDHTEGKSDAAVLKEIISLVYNSIEKIGQIVQNALKRDKVSISPAIFIRLMRHYLGRLSAPFEGEPLSGVQVMGILETRCLDFSHLLIIGMNEDFWPGRDSMPSMIPVGIRRGFGLPGPDETEAMVSYYFYRLIQRAETITMTWNTVRDGLSGGELSRFCYQLMMQTPHSVTRINQELPIQGIHPLKIEVTFNPQSPGNFTDAGSENNPLSPSAIIAFLTCSLKFYFRYVAGLKEPDEMVEDITRQLFGNIFHKAMELVYSPLSGQLCNRERLGRLLGDREYIRECVRMAFNTEYFGGKPEEREPVPLEGKSILIASTLETYILHMLEADMRQAPILIHSLEKKFLAEIITDIDGRKRKITIGGTIDRVDETDGIIRVIDYKTGNVGNNATAFRSIQELFDTESREIKKEAIQALVYSLILDRTAFSGKNIRPVVHSVLKLKDATFNPMIRMNGEPVVFAQVRDDLMRELEKILCKIFSDSYHYKQTRVTERCRVCPYIGLCERW